MCVKKKHDCNGGGRNGGRTARGQGEREGGGKGGGEEGRGRTARGKEAIRALPCVLELHCNDSTMMYYRVLTQQPTMQ